MSVAGAQPGPRRLGVHTAKLAGAAPWELAPGTASLGLCAFVEVSLAACFRQGHREFLQDAFGPRTHAGEEATAPPTWPWHPGPGRRPLGPAVAVAPPLPPAAPDRPGTPSRPLPPTRGPRRVLLERPGC